MQKRLEIGQIVNTFGIKGQVKVVPFTDDITRFDYLKKVYIVNKKLRKEVEVENVKYHKDMVLLKFKGLDRIEDVEIYKNSYLEIDRKDAIPLEEGTYFIADLLESELYSDEGEKLGTYFNYTLSIGRIVNKNVYNALYAKLVSNDEYHTVQMPSADGQMFTFEAYFDSISDEIVRSIDGVNTFKGLTVEFIARRRAL